MASRKKLDEKNLKTVRELGALQFNKYCFDCNQRGPTYVNVTIGSFVCTKCSGLLRGLTPPHRVKSISMATFTSEEVELLKSKGNESCAKTWLGLFEGKPPCETSDELTIKDFMIKKYEHKRFYMESPQQPQQQQRNGYAKPQPQPEVQKKHVEAKTNRPNHHIVNNINNNHLQLNNRKRPEVTTKGDFVADFDSADIFSSSNISNFNHEVSSQQNHQQQQQQQQAFANFDNNPIFNGGVNSNHDDFSIFDLTFTKIGPVLNQVPLFPKCNVNRWSMPLPSAVLQLNHQNNLNLNQTPMEDKYAALKDLDNALKTQTTMDWSSGSNGSLYSSPTPTGSMYSSPSPQNSVFGSPSQGPLVNGFSMNHETDSQVSNPFNTSNLSWNSNVTNMSYVAQQFANPFRANEPTKMNGFSQAFPSTIYPVPSNGTNWSVNPFKVGGTTLNSNNPFL